MAKQSKGYYGIPYQGSKNSICAELHRYLPAGERFVDLFGGGFAMTHYAMGSGKYRRFYYNDIEPTLAPLIKNAIAGKYSVENFTPNFISREEFKKRKDSDGYVKWIWSFGNAGRAYIFGKDVEPIKRAAHQFVVFGEWSDELADFCGAATAPDLGSGNYQQRRLKFRQFIKSQKKRLDLEQLERLERLQQLERLERLQQLDQLNRLERLEQLEQLKRLQQLEQLTRLERLEFHCHDYREYKHQDGDVVYCDIPYLTPTSNGSYGVDFDYGAFWQWAVTQPYPVYFSHYTLGAKLWNADKRNLFSSTKKNLVSEECLYVADMNHRHGAEYKQMSIFDIESEVKNA